MKNHYQYDYYLVLDLEATCCNEKTIKQHEMEIIEIGAVMVEPLNLTVIDEFQTFIKPVRHPILTEFCQSLTSINQAQVEQAPSYLEAIALLKTWLSNYPNGVFGSWGDYDRRQFQQDSKFHKVPLRNCLSARQLKAVIHRYTGFTEKVWDGRRIATCKYTPRRNPSSRD